MSVPVIETRGVSRQFTLGNGVFGNPQTLNAVSEVSLSLAEGETLGIAGESGCGKSTLAKLIMGLITPTGGKIFFRGTQLSGMTPVELAGFRKAVQIVFQDPFSSLNPRMRVGEIIAEPIRIHAPAAGKELHTQVSRLMQETGLNPEHADRYPHEFSGGQRQRIGIARALAVSPQVLIADEPVSALDLSIQAQIINLLMELKRTRGLSLIFIAHDLSVVRHVSDRIAVMYLGRIVEIGPGNDLFTRPLHPYTEALISAIPRIRPAPGARRIVLAGDIPSPMAIPPGCPFSSRCPYAREKCLQTPPLLEYKNPGHMAACHYTKEIFLPQPLY